MFVFTEREASKASEYTGLRVALASPREQKEKINGGKLASSPVLRPTS